MGNTHFFKHLQCAKRFGRYRKWTTHCTIFEKIFYVFLKFMFLRKIGESEKNWSSFPPTPQKPPSLSINPPHDFDHCSAPTPHFHFSKIILALSPRVSPIKSLTTCVRVFCFLKVQKFNLSPTLALIYIKATRSRVGLVSCPL